MAIGPESVSNPLCGPGKGRSASPTYCRSDCKKLLLVPPFHTYCGHKKAQVGGYMTLGHVVLPGLTRIPLTAHSLQAPFGMVRDTFGGLNGRVHALAVLGVSPVRGMVPKCVQRGNSLRFGHVPRVELLRRHVSPSSFSPHIHAGTYSVTSPRARIATSTFPR